MNSQAQRFSWDGAVSRAMADAYDADGFLVIDGFASAQACETLWRRIDQILEEAEAPEAPTVFGDHADDRYFLESGDKTRFFFEPKGIDEEGRPTRPIGAALNKIGHAMHDLDPAFSHFFRTPSFAALAAGLAISNPVLMQSMVIFKQPEIGAPVSWHQDATFLRTEPHSVTGFWIALEDAAPENGCLYAIPGGHKGPLRRWFGRDKSGQNLHQSALDETPFAEDQAVPLPAKPGTLVVLHGYLPHMSTPNLSPKSRRALTLHTVDGTLHYPADNWLQRPALGDAKGFENKATP